jgi:hypothetical protein
MRFLNGPACGGEDEIVLARALGAMGIVWVWVQVVRIGLEVSVDSGLRLLSFFGVDFVCLLANLTPV